MVCLERVVFAENRLERNSRKESRYLKRIGLKVEHNSFLMEEVNDLLRLISFQAFIIIITLSGYDT